MTTIFFAEEGEEGAQDTPPQEEGSEGSEGSGESSGDGESSGGNGAGDAPTQ